MALKDAGRIGRRADGSFGVLARSRYPEQAEPRAQDEQRHVSQAADRLDRQGLGAQGLRRVDDRGHAYSDRNYWNFCAPGAAVVAMYYFANSHPLATGIPARTYTEPRNNGYQATTYWTATDRSSNGRGALMWMAEYVKPPVVTHGRFEGWLTGVPRTPLPRRRIGCETP